MISLPSNFDVTLFSSSLFTLGIAIVGIAMVFFVGKICMKVIKMAGSIG